MRMYIRNFDIRYSVWCKNTNTEIVPPPPEQSLGTTVLDLGFPCGRDRNGAKKTYPLSKKEQENETY